MATYRVTYGNSDTEDIQAEYYSDEKSFIDFYDFDDDGDSRRVLRITSGGVRRIALIDDDD